MSLDIFNNIQLVRKDNSGNIIQTAAKEAQAPFQKFQAADTIKWFEDRDVNLKYESDGRMFPITDRSETIIDCFIKETNKHKVKLLNKKNVNTIKKLQDGRLTLSINEGESFIADSVLIATGSKPLGYNLATALGHSITEIAPSLFTFKIDDPILENLSGTSFSNATLTLKIENSKPFIQTGALLITLGFEWSSPLKIIRMGCTRNDACLIQS